ncbi:glycosyltransferase [Candidatus Saccharibacteria bacterium]|nr:glycosyltransferase [Candidatus Saccharibacteria bacterium]
MKIAIFSDCYLDLTGGIVTSINSQKAELEKLGHTVTIFSTAYPKTEKELEELARKNIFVVPSCKYCFRGATPVSRRPKIIEKWLEEKHPEIKNYDIYYVHYESGCSIAGLRLGKKFKIPTVQVMHGREDMGEATLIPFGFRTIVATLLNWFHSWYIPHKIKVRRDEYLADTIAKSKMWTLMVNHANYASIVLTPSEHMKKKLQHYGVVRKIEVFPNSVSDTMYPKNPTAKILEPGHELRIIWHSRVSSEKRIMPFLKALRMINGKYRLDVYGGGNELKKAKRYAKRHKLNVFFHGVAKIDKVIEAISKSHLDVLVSYNYDTFGMTLIEAEAAGVPVFFCDKDLEEIVPKGSFVLSADESASEIAASLQNLLLNPDKIHSMSNAMLSHRKEVLTSNRIKILLKIFNDIIKT